MSTAARPVLGASLAIWRRNEVLLIQRDRPPFAGAWSLPGGKVEFGETVEMTARRETLEETGVNADILGLATYLDVIDTDHHFVVMVFAGLYRSGEPFAGDGTRNIAWTRPVDLPGLATTPRLSDAIQAAQAVVQGRLSDRENRF